VIVAQDAGDLRHLAVGVHNRLYDVSCGALGVYREGQGTAGLGESTLKWKRSVTTVGELRGDDEDLAPTMRCVAAVVLPGNKGVINHGLGREVGVVLRWQGMGEDRDFAHEREDPIFSLFLSCSGFFVHIVQGRVWPCVGGRPLVAAR
jgi:hypothetical protein